MNTISIALMGIKRDFRDRRTLIFLLAFPIALMLILGLALTNAFGSSTNVGDMRVLVKDTSGGGQLSQSFTAFAKALGTSGVTFETLKTGMNGREEVEQNRYDDYVELSQGGISLYGSSRNTVESNIVQGMLTVFTDKYNAAAAVAKSDPDKAQLVFAGGTAGGYIKETSIDKNRKPGSIDYYAMAMSVMVGLWGAMSAGGLIRGEIVRGTATRLIAAPVRKSEIFTGKVLGSIVLNMLCILVIVLFSKFAFKAYWGDHLGIVLAVLLSEVVMAVSLGLAASYLLKDGASRGAIMLITQLAAFFGGAYFPIGDDAGPGIMGFIVQLSPIRWANHALTQIIYGDTLSAAWPVISLNLGLAVLLLGASAAVMRKREGL